MLRDLLEELMAAWDENDAIRKGKAYKELRKVGMDAITANILVRGMRKEKKERAEGGGA